MNDPLNKATPSEDLMTRVARGDDNAFEILVHRHQQAILNLIYHFMGRRARAEDLAQEVFLRIWQSAGRYKPTAKFTTWIYRITANLCFNELKALGRRRRLFVEPSQGVDLEPEEVYPNADEGKALSPEDLLITSERNRQLLNAIQQLPANQRMALLLKRFEGLSYEEIAQIMGRSAQAVDSLMVRAKRNLQKNLSEPPPAGVGGI